MPKGKLWRMKEKCADCPFSKTGPGLHLRRTLRPGRWREILASLRRGEHFCCHCERIDYWVRQGKIKTGGNQFSPPQSK